MKIHALDCSCLECQPASHLPPKVEEPVVGRGEPIKCACGHDKTKHSLRDGIQGDGMCCAWDCKCEGFERQVELHDPETGTTRYSVPTRNRKSSCKNCSKPLTLIRNEWLHIGRNGYLHWNCEDDSGRVADPMPSSSTPSQPEPLPVIAQKIVGEMIQNLRHNAQPEPKVEDVQGARQRVLAVYPEAFCQTFGGAPIRFYISRVGVFDSDLSDMVDTREAAWLDAASKLPPSAEPPAAPRHARINCEGNRPCGEWNCDYCHPAAPVEPVRGEPRVVLKYTTVKPEHLISNEALSIWSDAENAPDAKTMACELIWRRSVEFEAACEGDCDHPYCWSRKAALSTRTEAQPAVPVREQIVWPEELVEASTVKWYADYDEGDLGDMALELQQYRALRGK